MDALKINKSVLVAPLDWGLGHATRCIPIINMLLKKGCHVIIAVTGSHKILLQQAFPTLLFLELDGYNIRYAKKNTLLKLAQQLPKVLQTIDSEHRWLEKMIAEHNINFVISDNRYGLWNTKIPCILITHQLQLAMPTLFGWATRLVQQKLYSFINRFSTCWVPDMEIETESLSGKLGHPQKMPTIAIKYVGFLSRFPQIGTLEKKYEVMVCLSGPEPQRSLFEEILLPQLKNVQGKVLLVRGKPGSQQSIPSEKNITIYDHLPTADMQRAFLQSEYIISRCGYTTLMDMQMLQCKCIYVPTPGQTEQEYLGKRLTAERRAIVVDQQGFNLKTALERATNFNFKHSSSYHPNGALERAVDEMLGSEVGTTAD